MIAQALFTSFGGGTSTSAVIAQLASSDERAIATTWGLAMRLGQRLSGGAAGPLSISKMSLTGESVVLSLSPADRALAGEAVDRRHRQLAAALGRAAVLA